MSIVNALTIDVEDYFQVSALAPHFPRGEWESVPCRVERNIDVILTMLNEYGAKGTFFTLGWIAERYPYLVRHIASEGHEIASHGYAHQRASDQTPEAFLADIGLAKNVLEDVTGTAVLGYRAPSFSIGESNAWAHDCISRAGYKYSSSRVVRNADYHRAFLGPQSPGRWRGLFPTFSVCCVTLVGPQGECG